MSTQELLIFIPLFIGLIGTFRWIFNKVTGETIGWYYTITFVGLPAVIKKLANWMATIFGSDSVWISDSAGFATYILLFYLLLRMWHDVKPKQAWIIIACWVPLLIASILIFVLTNQAELGQPN